MKNPISYIISRHIRLLLLLPLWTAYICTARADIPAGTILRGTVTDSISGEPMAYVNVYLNASQGGTVTDENGRFSVKASRPVSKITVSSLGYDTKYVAVNKRNAAHLKVKMSPADYMLAEVVIRPKKEKYSKKNNPAVDFMRRLRASADRTNPTKEPYYSYDFQEKIVLGLADYDSIKAKPGKKEPRSAFLNEYIEDVPTSKNKVLKISVKERRGTELYGSDPKLHKSYTYGQRSAGLDRSINAANVQVFLNDLMRDVDIYKPDITLVQTRFVSPLSPIAADYYKFYLDTVTIDGERTLQLQFVPHNPESPGFNGKLFVPLADTASMFVKRIEMRVPNSINVNYIRDMYISQEFEIDSLGNRHKVVDDMAVDFQIIPGTQSLYAQRYIKNRNFSYDRREDLDKIYREVGKDHIAFDADLHEQEFWDNDRAITLTPGERNMGNIYSRMRKNPWFYYPEKIISWLVNGYICTSTSKSKFDIGPITSFISYESAEGLRLRFGGITTANLSRRWFGRAYVAYGFRDHKWKYSVEGEYSFNDKKYQSREFPVHSLRVTHTYDMDALGQRYAAQADNIFLSWKRASNNKVTYRRLTTVEYIHEFRNHLSFNIGFRQEVQEGTRWLPFLKSDGSLLPRYREASFVGELRWAPGETFIQGNSNRTRTNLDNLTLTLYQEYGPKGFLGSRYEINKTEISAKKRFWFSSFGSADVMLKAGKIWSQVEFPALMWPAANLTYTIQPGSFSLMNPMEFALDQYVQWDLTYNGNGILFNRIPGIKKLKIREIFTFKGIYGSLTDKNNPAKNSNLFPFPQDAKVNIMGSTPYMEISAGIDNILTLFRVDYVWRLSYRNNPGAARSGLRVGVHFTF